MTFELFVDSHVFIMSVARAFFGACSDGLHRNLQSGPEWTSPTPKLKNLLKGENPSIAPGIEGSGIVHGSKT